MLYPDTVIMTRKAVEAGSRVELEVGERMFHVWPLIDMPEARAARQRMVAFLAH